MFVHSTRATMLATLTLSPFAAAQGDFSHAPPSLRSVSPPKVPGIEEVVQDQQWAIVLGKALFWDVQGGSDGMACASCHFHAGADNRFVNQLSPSLLHQDPAKAGVFDPTMTGVGGPNYVLTLADFPFHLLADIKDRESAVLFDSDDVVSSAGVFKATFGGIGSPNTMFDDCVPQPDDLFNIGELNTRRVEPRNTPTVVNAVFNFRNFWDGRANNEFNGIDPFGPRNPTAHVLCWDGRSLFPKRLRLRNSSLASQAVGPPLSDFEMSCAGRSFPDIAQKLLPRQALAFQAVAADDSVLGPHMHPSGTGLTMTYEQLVHLAFRPQWWAAPASASARRGMALQIEHNFSMFWGLAIQLYESTLVSDQTRYDDWAEGDADALTAEELHGLDIFLNKGKCVNCHKGPDFTGAGWVLQGENKEGGLVERMFMAREQVALYDNGFYNIGVRPTKEDLGVGGTDPWGNPLSHTRQWLDFLNTGSGMVNPFQVNPSTFEVQRPLPPFPTHADLQLAFGSDPDAVDGAFKTPGLRNVELTGPYFHNGGQATLDQVLDFYNRGGDRRSVSSVGDTSGFGQNRSNLDPDITNLFWQPNEHAAVKAFLLTLTDERVRWEMAPFDHPALPIPHGHQPLVHPQLGAPMAADTGVVLPAVGAGGRAPLNLPPLQSFESQLP